MFSGMQQPVRYPFEKRLINTSTPLLFAATSWRRTYYNLADKLVGQIEPPAARTWHAEDGDAFEAFETAKRLQEGTSRVQSQRDSRAVKARAEMDRFESKLAAQPNRLDEDPKFRDRWEKSHQTLAFHDRKVTEAKTLLETRKRRVSEIGSTIGLKLSERDTQRAEVERMHADQLAIRERNALQEAYKSQAASRERSFQAGLTHNEIATKQYLEEYVRDLHGQWHEAKQTLNREYGRAMADLKHNHQLTLLSLEREHKFSLIPLEEELYAQEAREKKAEFELKLQEKHEELRKRKEEADKRIAELNKKAEALIRLEAERTEGPTVSSQGPRQEQPEASTSSARRGSAVGVNSQMSLDEAHTMFDRMMMEELSELPRVPEHNPGELSLEERLARLRQDGETAVPARHRHSFRW